MLLFPIILLLLILGSDSYIFFCFLKSWPVWAKILWWVPSAALIVSIIVMFRGNWGWPASVAIGLLLCVALPKLIFCLLSLSGAGLGLIYAPVATWFNIAGAAIAGVVCLCSLYGITAGWKHLIVKRMDIENAKLPAAFDGYTIAQISDLHLGTFGNDASHIAKMVDSINALHPDLIVFTGDLVNFTYNEVTPFKAELSRLRARDGVLSILGNHDYALYTLRLPPDSAQRMVDSLIATEHEMGWRVLLDENVPIARGSDTIRIAGVQNIGRRFSAGKGNLQKALAGIPDDIFTILLSHDPTHWDSEVQPTTDIPLTLSGHTHSMQIKIFGWSPSSWVFPHWNGLYRIGDQQIYVSPGTGGNLPFRFGAWPEITLITLKKQK